MSPSKKTVFILLNIPIALGLWFLTASVFVNAVQMYADDLLIEALLLGTLASVGIVSSLLHVFWVNEKIYP